MEICNFVQSSEDFSSDYVMHEMLCWMHSDDFLMQISGKSNDYIYALVGKYFLDNFVFNGDYDETSKDEEETF